MTQPLIKPTDLSRFNREHGFSLLEVLIALLVLSIGLLGVAGLQTYSLQFNHQSYERTQATLLISEVSEKIMANPMAAGAGSFDSVPFGSSSASYGSYGGCPASCANAGDLATYDLFIWKSTIENPKVLAGGTAQIDRVPDPLEPAALVYDIQIQWIENNLQQVQRMRVRTL